LTEYNKLECTEIDSDSETQSWGHLTLEEGKHVVGLWDRAGSGGRGESGRAYLLQKIGI